MATGRPTIPRNEIARLTNSPRLQSALERAFYDVDYTLPDGIEEVRSGVQDAALEGAGARAGAVAAQDGVAVLQALVSLLATAPISVPHVLRREPCDGCAQVAALREEVAALRAQVRALQLTPI